MQPWNVSNPRFVRTEENVSLFLVRWWHWPLEVEKQRNCLIGYCLGRRFPFMMIKKFVGMDWNTFGKLEVVLNGQGYFILWFQNEVHMLGATKGGPWDIVSQPFLSKKMGH